MAQAVIKNPSPIELYNLGSVGIIRDRKPHLLVPEAWSNGNNVRFDNTGVTRMQDLEDAFGTLELNPEFIMNVPTPGANFWLYAGLNKVYVYDGTSSTEITNEDGDYTVAEGFGRLWQGTILGGVPILNNSTDVPQYWSGLDTSHKLVDLDGWPDDLRAFIIRAFGPYLVAFNLVDGSDILQKTMQWSSFADPGTVPASWDYTDATVDAGRTQLTDDKGGEILDALLLGDNMVVYCTNSTHVLKYVGGVAIFSPQLLLKESGILGTHCCCNFNKGTAQAVITGDDVIVHQGTQSAQSIVEDRMRSEMFNEIDSTNYRNSFAVENTKKKEVWFCYPTAGNVIPNKALIWNYKDNVCSFRDVHLVSADSGNSYVPDSTTWSQDTGNWDTDNLSWNSESRNTVIGVSNDAASALKFDAGYNPNVLSFVERTGIAIDGKDRNGQPKASIQSTKQLNRMWIKATGNAVLIVRVGSQEIIDGPITWSDPQQFNCGTDKYLDWTIVGKLLAYRFENNDGLPWQIQGIDLEIERLSDL
jgi:hypothetical protein